MDLILTAYNDDYKDVKGESHEKMENVSRFSST
jgi:DNA-binding protein YbaB